jgi:hypothetical protein
MNNVTPRFIHIPLWLTEKKANELFKLGSLHIFCMGQAIFNFCFSISFLELLHFSYYSDCKNYITTSESVVITLLQQITLLL